MVPSSLRNAKKNLCNIDDHLIVPSAHNLRTLFRTRSAQISEPQSSHNHKLLNRTGSTHPEAENVESPTLACQNPKGEKSKTLNF